MNESRERPNSQKGASHPGSTEKSKKDAKASKKTGDSSSSASAVNSTLGGTVIGNLASNKITSRRLHLVIICRKTPKIRQLKPKKMTKLGAKVTKTYENEQIFCQVLQIELKIISYRQLASRKSLSHSLRFTLG